MAVIYLLEVGDESYVGKTCNLQRRMREHKCRARDGTSKLYKTIRDKEFKFSHKKLDECEDRTARIVEQAYITELNPSLNTNSAWGNDKVKKMARYKRKIMKKKHCKCCNKIISSTNWAKHTYTDIHRKNLSQYKIYDDCLDGLSQKLCEEKQNDLSTGDEEFSGEGSIQQE
jgi:hypothetical protein